MQVAMNYAANAVSGMERALAMMPVALASVKPLPVTMQDISRYVEQLLTPEQQRVCDMATD